MTARTIHKNVEPMDADPSLRPRSWTANAQSSNRASWRTAIRLSLGLSFGYDVFEHHFAHLKKVKTHWNIIFQLFHFRTTLVSPWYQAGKCCFISKLFHYLTLFGIPQSTYTSCCFHPLVFGSELHRGLSSSWDSSKESSTVNWLETWQGNYQFNYHLCFNHH